MLDARTGEKGKTDCRIQSRANPIEGTYLNQFRHKCSQNNRVPGRVCVRSELEA